MQVIPKTTEHRTTSRMIELMVTRHSASPKRLGWPAPSQQQISQMIKAAMRIPDYGQLHPCRYIEIPHNARNRLAMIFVNAKRRTNQALTSQQLKREFDKAMQAPLLIAAYARLQPDHPKVTINEQLVSVGASIQNFMLAAHSLNFGSIILSGDRLHSPELKTAFNLQTHDTLIGFISIGTVIKPKETITSSTVADVYHVWDCL